FTNQRTTVYNLSVQGSPTYFVSEHGMLVHNCSSLPAIDFAGTRGAVAADDLWTKLALEEVASGMGAGKKIIDDLGDPALQAVEPGKWSKWSVDRLRHDGRIYEIHYSQHDATGLRWDVKYKRVR